MNMIRDGFEALGIRDTPWIMRIYFALLIVCCGLIIFAAIHLNGDTPNQQMVKLFDFAMDNFKLVLGAVIGSLSTAATAEWGRTTRAPRRQPTPRQGDGQ